VGGYFVSRNSPLKPRKGEFFNHGTHGKHGKKVLTTKNMKNAKKRTHPNKPNAIFGLISDKFG
jgi:hypothetical protein